MKALVTGSAGFIGRHFATELASRGYRVTSCDVDSVQDAFTRFRRNDTQFDLVVHAAAREPHRAAIEGQPATFPYNVALDASMFDWAVRTGQGRVLYLSSSAVYPVDTQTGNPAMSLLEDLVVLDSAEEPDARYGWAKLTGERMAVAASEAGLAVHVVRPFSGYGEDQDERWPFGALMGRARRREDPYVIWGPGIQVRDWVHVDDVVAASLAVIEADVLGPVNICTGIGTSMLDLAAMACERVGYSPRFELHREAPTGVMYRVGDPTRMQEHYVPKIGLDEGVSRALA